MGFWDKVKRVFGGGSGKQPPEDPPSETTPASSAPVAKPVARSARRPSNRTWRLEKRGATLILNAPHGAFAVKALSEAVRDTVAKAREGQEFTCQGDFDGTGNIENLVVTAAVEFTPPQPAVRTSSAGAPSRLRPPGDDGDNDDGDNDDGDSDDDDAAARGGGGDQSQHRWQNPEILGLGAADFRRRALKINPFRTAWIGRVDTIPPQSDERTALIDRGLILRGLLTPEQLARIHEIGDEWLKHHDAIKLAEAAAAKSASAAVEAERERRRQLKLQKRQEAAERKAARVAEIEKRKATDIIFAGRGVSARLHDRRVHVEKLEEHRLPVLATPADVATALGLTIPQLRWLTFHSDATPKTHYVYFEVPKRSGGTRLLAAPHHKLATAQRWILDAILSRLPLTPQAHGFVPERSTVTNALPHVGKQLVVNLDLKDFFPSITFPRVRGLFESLGYSPAAATLLALIVTEAPRMKVVHDGTPFWVAAGDRALPQGACTSPVISNLVARKLDRRLAGACAKVGWTYTRYADDLTFSTDAKGTMSLMMSRVRAIVRDEGFTVNEAKGRVARRGGRQSVTGIVVNDKLAIPRDELRRVRAILHGAKQTGLAQQNRAGLPDFEAHLRGKLAYFAMIDAAKAAPLLAQLDAITSEARPQTS